MNKEKTYKGNLNIGKKVVSIETDKNWAGIEITFAGNMRINSLLGDDFIVNTGRKKIIVMKLNQTEYLDYDLFEYTGRAMITRCNIVTPELDEFSLYVNKHSLQLWNTLMKSERDGETAGVEQDWAYLGENWEDLDFDGNNDKRDYIYRRTIYDKESKTYTEIKELRKK
tara:strand:+ start:60 stop:566 length:507 start_codon:yes stop_codon:yes gene_type:complete